MKVVDKARPFYRSEAFPEDVAEFVEPALSPAVKTAPLPRRQRPALMLWLLGLLPLAALTVGASWVI